MHIKTIVIDGYAGEVEIARTDDGAVVTAGGRVVCQVPRGQDRESCWPSILEAARAICGTTKPGRYWGGGQPNATNSMIHDVADMIERVAG